MSNGQLKQFSGISPTVTILIYVYTFSSQVYFLWICPSHRHFEWFIDVLRDVEKKDVTNVLEIHIFITQFFHKFDLRTTMLVRNDFIRTTNRIRATKS